MIEAKSENESSCVSDEPDYELLQRFMHHQDEAAFTSLVQRHSTTVIAVCQRVLRNEHDAEDAFQATFLVLAKNAHKVRKCSSLGSWLYSVAYRISNRANSKRQSLKERIMGSEPMHFPNTLDLVADAHDYELVDAELNRLPDKFREPLAMHYLMGRTNKEIAKELGTTIGVIEGRLKRGKHELRTRLARRGVNLAIVVTALQASLLYTSDAADDLL